MTDKFVNFLENFSSETLAELDSIYHEDISYIDPINKGQGIEHLRLIMQDLPVFKNVKLNFWKSLKITNWPLFVGTCPINSEEKII